MRKKNQALILILTISTSLLVSGCGSTKDSSAEAQVLILKGCNDYNSNNVKPTFEYVTFFSKLAISDPAYIEIARASGVLMALHRTDGTTWADSVRGSYFDSRGLLDGFCASVK